MEIKNELKAIEDIRLAIKRGYGYEQLKDKLEITDAEIIKLGSKHPDFLNEFNKRYNLNLNAEEKASEIKEVKEEVKTSKPKAKGK